MDGSSRMNAESPEFVPEAERRRIVWAKLSEMDAFHRCQLEELLRRQSYEQQSLQHRLFREHYDDLAERPLIGAESLLLKFPRQMVLLQCYELYEEDYEYRIEQMRKQRDADLDLLKQQYHGNLKQRASDQIKEMHDLCSKHSAELQSLQREQCQEYLSELLALQQQQLTDLKIQHNEEMRAMRSQKIGREFQLRRSWELQVRDLKEQLNRNFEGLPELEPILLLDPTLYLKLRREGRENRRLMLEKKTAEAKKEAAKHVSSPTSPCELSDGVKEELEIDQNKEEEREESPVSEEEESHLSDKELTRLSEEKESLLSKPGKSLLSKPGKSLLPQQEESLLKQEVASTPKSPKKDKTRKKSPLPSSLPKPTENSKPKSVVEVTEKKASPPPLAPGRLVEQLIPSQLHYQASYAANAYSLAQYSPYGQNVRSYLVYPAYDTLNYYYNPNYYNHIYKVYDWQPQITYPYLQHQNVACIQAGHNHSVAPYPLVNFRNPYSLPYQQDASLGGAVTTGGGDQNYNVYHYNENTTSWSGAQGQSYTHSLEQSQWSINGSTLPYMNAAYPVHQSSLQRPPQMQYNYIPQNVNATDHYGHNYGNPHQEAACIQNIESNRDKDPSLRPQPVETFADGNQPTQSRMIAIEGPRGIQLKREYQTYEIEIFKQIGYSPVGDRKKMGDPGDPNVNKRKSKSKHFWVSAKFL